MSSGGMRHAPLGVEPPVPDSACCRVLDDTLLAAGTAGWCKW